MNIKILAKFCNEFKHKDIDRKFDLLIAYKDVYMLDTNKNINDDSVNWIYQ